MTGSPFRYPDTPERIGRVLQEPDTVWIPFNEAGKPTAGDSAQCPVPTNGTIREWSAYQETADGSTATVLKLYVNGTLKDTLTLPAASTAVVVNDGLSIPVATRDKIKVTVFSLGASTSDIGGTIVIRRH